MFHTRNTHVIITVLTPPINNSWIAITSETTRAGGDSFWFIAPPPWSGVLFLHDTVVSESLLFFRDVSQVLIHDFRNHHDLLRLVRFQFIELRKVKSRSLIFSLLQEFLVFLNHVYFFHLRKWKEIEIINKWVFCVNFEVSNLIAVPIIK